MQVTEEMWTAIESRLETLERQLQGYGVIENFGQRLIIDEDVKVSDLARKE